MRHLLPLLLSATLSAQAPAVQWQRTFGGTDNDESAMALPARDGGCYVFGHTLSMDGDIEAHNGYQDYWVLRLDNTGSVLWKKNFGGSSAEWLYMPRPTPDGGFLLSGMTASNDFDVSGFKGIWDAWLMKMDSSGNLLWQKCLGGSKIDEVWDAHQTDDGGYVMAGSSTSDDGDLPFNRGATDCWIVKLNADLDIEWQRVYGGSDYDEAYSVSPTSDGGYIVAAASQSDDGDVAGGTSGMDVWILKLNFDGKIEWQRTYGGSGIDQPLEIAQTSDGGYIFIGHTNSPNGDVVGKHGKEDIWAVKLAANGDIEWQRPMGGDKPDWGASIQQTSDGGYVLCGTVNSSDGDVTGFRGNGDFWVAKLSGQGDMLWSKTLGGSKFDRPYLVRQSLDGGYIVSGHTWSNDFDVPQGVKGRSDYWVVKLAPESSAAAEAAALPLSIFPNPAQNSISIRAPGFEGTLDAAITDLSGRALLQKRAENGSSLDVSALPPGMYLLRAVGPDGAGYLGKLVVDR